MRIAFQTLFVVLVCVLGGLASSLLIGTRYQELQNLQVTHSANLLNLREVEHQQIMLSQWFVIIDLFFNQHQSYLVNGIKIQARQLTDMLDTMLIQDIKGKEKHTVKIQLLDNITALQKNIRILSTIITTAAVLPAAQGKNWNLTVKQADLSSQQVIKLLEKILSQYIQLSQLSEKKLEQHKQSLPWVIGSSLLVYLLMVLWTWHWASKSTIRPLEALSAKADHVSDTDNDQGFQLHQGPKEVRQLGLSLQKYSLQLQQKILQANAATKKIERQKQQLQEKICELTKTRLQLIHSEKLASIGQLAAGVAHEINNPIYFVTGNLETLNEYQASIMSLLQGYQELESCISANDDFNSRRLIRNIKQLKQQHDMDFVLADMGELINESLIGTARIQKIVQDLQSFAREDDTAVKEVDLNNEVIETAVQMVWSKLKYKCTLNKTLTSLPKYGCHCAELSQVIMNLLINACDAIGDNGVIGINSEFKGGNILIEVRDNGSGIREQDLLKVFDPFFTTKEIGKGIGLGLSISQGIIKKHGGEITVSSGLGKGTSFTILLPLLTGKELAVG